MTEPIPEVTITTRPFIDDLLSEPPTAARPISAGANTHLYAAVGATQKPESARATRRGRTTPTHAGVTDYLDVDWDVVSQLAEQLEINQNIPGARDRANFDVALAPPTPETPQEEAVSSQIAEIIDRHVAQLVSTRGADHDWTPRRRAHYAQAVFDQAFRYGRLSQYLREEEVEDISITAHDNVAVTKTSGLVEDRPSIASNATELEIFIAWLSQLRGRNFNRPGGWIDLDLGGARLSATGVGPTSEPNMTIRKHNMVGVKVADLVKKGTLTSEVADFLNAAAAANFSIMIGGYPKAGKTTFLRALASNAHRDEKIVTIETERELYLHKLIDRHRQVQDLQYQPAQHSSVDSSGGLTLDMCLELALRSSAERVIFAETRGFEGPVLMKAMAAGKGAMSTIHARSAKHVITRLADILVSEQGLTDRSGPLAQIGDNLDLIVYLDTETLPDGKRQRRVTEVAEVTRNDNGEPLVANIYEYDWHTGKYLHKEPVGVELSKRLQRVGFNTTTMRWEQ